jgi:L-ascorbate metabolism protein UlaG (beta-lactamase superfamily)
MLVDPFSESLGYPIPQLPPIDVIAVTHEHKDHNNVHIAAGSPEIIHGLSGHGWHPQHFTYEDLSVKVIAGAYHDMSNGREHGRTALLSIETGGVKVLHLGDLGHELDVNLLAQCKDHSIALVPIGGHFTINGVAAGHVIDAINPDVAIPMHYKTPAVPHSPLAHLGDSGFLDNRIVRHLENNCLRLGQTTFAPRTEVVVPQLPSLIHIKHQRQQPDDKSQPDC